MITLFYWPTPNCWKVSILLEELGDSYKILPVNIQMGAQFAREFRAVNLNSKVPAIIDTRLDTEDPIVMAESGAILQYLADSTGRFGGETAEAKRLTTQWMYWQTSSLGPVGGQSMFYQLGRSMLPPDRRHTAFPAARYQKEFLRLFGVLNRQLEKSEYIAGDYGIVDIACWPWILSYRSLRIDLNQFRHLQRWYNAVGSRPAVRRGIAVGSDLRMAPSDLDAVEQAAAQAFLSDIT